MPDNNFFLRLAMKGWLKAKYFDKLDDLNPLASDLMEEAMEFVKSECGIFDTIEQWKEELPELLADVICELKVILEVSSQHDS